MPEKKCSRCNQVLPIEKFSKHKQAKDGLNSWCKDCGRLISLNYRLRNSEAVKERKKKYYNENKTGILLKEKTYRENNKEKISEQRKRIYQKDPSKFIERVKRWSLENPDKVKEYKRICHERNKEKYVRSQNERYHTEEGKLKHLARIRRYSQTEKGKITAIRKSNRRRTMFKGLESNYTAEQWLECKEHFDNRCAYCGKKRPLTHEHFIPLVKGGEYTKNNIIPSCKSCNSMKSDADFFTWYPRQSFYSEERENKILKYLNYRNKTQQLTLTV